MDHPELVSAVDFIAAHVLPYWEGYSGTQPRSTRRSATYNHAAPDLSRQAHRDRRVRLAERRLQSQGRQSRPHRAGHGAARFRVARRSARHRLQHHRSDRPAVEDLRRQRRRLLGPVRRVAAGRNSPGAARSSIPTTGRTCCSRSCSACCSRCRSSRMRRRDLRTGHAARRRRRNAAGAWFATVFAFWNGHYFVWGAAFALGLGVVLLIPLVFIALARIEEIAAVAFGRKPRRLLSTRRRSRRTASARKSRSIFRPIASRRRCSRRRSMRSRR